MIEKSTTKDAFAKGFSDGIYATIEVIITIIDAIGKTILKAVVTIFNLVPPPKL